MPADKQSLAERLQAFIALVERSGAPIQLDKQISGKSDSKMSSNLTHSGYGSMIFVPLLR